jgi:murein DD-endopeptidase MepM/ murein hydrolase activator NlpD
MPSPSQQPQASATVTPTPAETLSVRRSPAPRSGDEFDLENQVIDIGFPLEPSTRYRYRDNWLDRRAGPADPYNHAFESDDGRLLRLHDGIDIYGPQGAPVLSPFDGVVIDPSQRWTPWETDRYGLTVVVESTEPHSAGYAAMLVHLEEVWAGIGERVSRGDVIGVLGRTGNAEQTRAHLHFELRAPFEIDWSPMGENRRVDAFNPFPSLRRADPHL